MTSRWRVDLQPDSFSLHHWSILGGLSELAHRGDVELRCRSGTAPPGPGVALVVHDREQRVRKAIWIDVADSWTRNPVRRDRADAVWARNTNRVSERPLGFVAGMRSGHEPLRRYLAAAAVESLRTRDRTALRGAYSGLVRRPSPLPIEAFEAAPGGDARVLLQVRAWEPEETAKPDHRVATNEHRAELIRRLRSEFGTRFVGGFMRRPFACTAYPDLLTEASANQRAYLDLVRQSAVVVSVTGLHGSIPWKIAEYLAASRAIVSERITNRIPGPVDDAIVFFDDPEACLARCEALLSDPAACRARQEAARELWQREVRPDRLVLARLEEEFAPAEP